MLGVIVPFCGTIKLALNETESQDMGVGDGWGGNGGGGWGVENRSVVSLRMGL